jgi:DNA-binding transcriptional ArsR family regulator
MFQRGRITDRRTIALLASPVRQEVIDTVEALGGSATVRELAAQLGRPADGLYYHLEILTKGGLLVAWGSRDGRRYRIPARTRLRLVYRDDNAPAVRGVARGMLRIARRDFEAAIGREGVVTDGPARELWASRGTGWLSPAEQRELVRLLTRATALLRHRRGGARDQLISLCFVLAPLAAKPIRR